MERLFNNTGILHKALDAASLRNEVISNNISNVDTPNYKAYKVEFEEQLKDALEHCRISGVKTNPRHLDVGASGPVGVTPVVKRIRDISYRSDGNSVDIDTEMANMAKNSVMYQTLVQLVNNKFSRIKSAINEGRR